MERKVKLVGIIIALMVSCLFFTILSEAAQVEIRAASLLDPGSIIVNSMEKFKAELEERSKGEIRVDLFPSGLLGDEPSILEQLTLGETQMNFGGTVVITSNAPQLYPFNFPFIFPSIDTVFEALNGELGERISNVVEQKSNIIILSYLPRPPRHLTTNKLILHPEDIKGLKLRLPTHPSWIIIWEALGTIPTPIAGAEIFNALQLGTVDAQENPTDVNYGRRIYEVQKYQILTDHLYSIRTWTVSKIWWDSLSSEHQKLILDVKEDVEKFQMNLVKLSEEEYMVKLQEKGMQIVIPAREEFRKLAIEVIPEAAKQLNLDPEVYETYVVPYLK